MLWQLPNTPQIWNVLLPNFHLYPSFWSVEEGERGPSKCCTSKGAILESGPGLICVVNATFSSFGDWINLLQSGSPDQSWGMYRKERRRRPQSSL